MGDCQNISLTGEHILNQSERSVCWRTDQLKKSPPFVQAVFQVAPTPISLQFLCSHPPLLLSTPNQNRHATQANLFHNKHTVNSLNNLTLYTYISFLKPCE